MDLGEFLKSPQSWANPEVIDATFHEDFIYLRETEMLPETSLFSISKPTL